MNIDTRPSIETRSTTSTTPRTLKRFGRLVAGAAAAFMLALGVGATMSSSPASAAGNVSYCFRHTNGSAYTYDVYLQLYSGGRWVTMTNVGRSSNGCNSVSISGTWRNYPVRMVATTRVGTYVFVGVTPYYAPAGSSSYNLGTGLVNM